MKDLDKALENLKFDKRMLDWNLNNGVLDPSELNAHKQNLKDLSANSAPLELADDSFDNDGESFNN